VAATDALRRRGSWRALLALLLAVVSWFAFAPVRFDDGGLPLDKARHLAAFGALAWVALQGFGRGAAWRVAAALLAYGVFIELVQSRIPGRAASGWDVLADAAGIALGLLAARAFSVAR
jgi:VanZ family protein